MKHLFPALLLAMGTCNITAHATSDVGNYPNAPIRFVVSTSPGGGADLTARLIGNKLSERLRQPVVIENRPGASGLIAGAFVAKAPADGYTLLFDITTYAVNPALQAKMPYVPLKDLVPVTQNIQASNVLVVAPSMPAHTLGEFIAYAKQRPGEVSFANAGNGSAQHLAMELFKRQAGIDLNAIPYKGGGPAMADTMAGHVNAYFGFLPAVTPHIKEGRLRPLATTGAMREKNFPEVPTFIESGMKGFISYDWNGIFAPGGTPQPVIRKIQHEVSEVLKLPEVRQKLAELGTEPVGSTPEEFEVFLKGEMSKWSKVVKEAGIKIE
ncbi:MAG TPA: tripartite tricarboxylate transporter substrate binding protein [Burkholderiaceae bacterium]